MTMKTKSIQPEICYDFKKLTRDELVNAYQKNESITGFVISVDESVINVLLGDGIFGKLAFDEVTIYPFKHTSGHKIPMQISTIMYKKIRVKILEISNNGTFILSRKANMLEAINFLEVGSIANFHATNTNRTMVFGDIGEGLNGCISMNDVCVCRINNINEYIRSGDIFHVKVLRINEKNQFYLSYKETFPPYQMEDYSRGDFVKGRVVKQVDKSGYFVDISPTVCGIMNILPSTPPLTYGQKITCYVYKAVEKGLKLRFVSISE